MGLPFHKPRIRAAILCAGVAVALLSTDLIGPLRSRLMNLEGLAQDSIAKQVARGPHALPPPSEILFLGIDEPSLALDGVDDGELAASDALAAMNEGWPWPRRVHAAAIERLVGAGARLVMLDLVFPRRPDSAADDAALAFALEDHAERVLVASTFLNVGDRTLLGFPDEAVLERTGPDDPRVGFVNFQPDPDQVVRHAEFFLTISDMAGTRPEPDEPVHLSFAAAAMRQLGRAEEVPKGRRRMLPLRADAGDGLHPYPVIPLYEIFVPDLWEANFEGGRVFDGKIVCIGPAASVLQDFHTTPMGVMMGPQLLLTALANLMEGRFAKEVPSGGRLALVGVLLLAVWLLATSRLPIGLGLAVLALFLPLYWFAAYTALARFDLFLPVAAPLVAVYGAGTAVYGAGFLATVRQRNHLRRTLAQRVSRNVAAAIMENPESFYQSLGGRRREVAVLFSDLRGFTTLSEQRAPEQVIEQLNEYLARMVDAVFANNGTLDKFIGDAVMAVWGNLESHGPDADARDAVAAALAMQRELATLNRAWRDAGRPELVMGIGIHHGPAIVGNIGSEKRMEPTVIGDTVNLAARIESLSKTYGVPIIVSGDTAARLDPAVTPWRRFDRIAVRGRTTPVDLCEVFLNADQAREWQECAGDYESALAAIDSGDLFRARTLLESCAARRPDDPAIRAVLERTSGGK